MTNNLMNTTEPGEFTAICNHYYKLTLLHARREERLKSELENAPAYCGQTSLAEVDALIAYYRMVQATKAKADKTLDDLMEMQDTILMIMQHFEIPPNTILTGTIPGEMEYEIYANEEDGLFITKTKDLAPEVIPDNIIVIKMCYGNGRDLEVD